MDLYSGKILSIYIIHVIYINITLPKPNSKKTTYLKMGKITGQTLLKKKQIAHEKMFGVISY